MDEWMSYKFAFCSTVFQSYQVHSLLSKDLTTVPPVLSHDHLWDIQNLLALDRTGACLIQVHFSAFACFLI